VRELSGSSKRPGSRAGLHGSSDTDPPSWGRRALKGFGVSGLNPKVFVLFLALLPQFTDPTGRWPTGVQILVLGLLHVVNCAAVYAVVGMGARLVLRARPAAALVVSRLSGAAMVGLGGFLLIEQVVH
jgi:threonine/homoserine/homoserine lactone efflux protein